MDYFNDNQAMDLLADFEATVLHDHGEESTDRGSEHAAQAATPVGSPMTEIPPSLHLPQPVYSVSTAFHAEFLVDGHKPDAILVSSDRVLFHAHTSQLIATSQNAFNGLLSVELMENVGRAPVIVTVPEGSVLLNVLIHTIYNMSSSQFNPSLDTLLESVHALKTYGIPLHRFVVPSTPLFNHILLETPRQPLNVFLVAAENKLEALAVAASGHLHSLPLPTISDEMAARMGPIYLKRLMKLHIDLVDDLKRLLLNAPQPHKDTVDCGFVQQKKLSRAWALAAASLVWDIRPDLPVSILRATLGSLEQQLDCSLCKASLNAKVRQVVLDWSTSTGRTI